MPTCNILLSLPSSFNHFLRTSYQHSSMFNIQVKMESTRGKYFKIPPPRLSGTIERWPSVISGMVGLTTVRICPTDHYRSVTNTSPQSGPHKMISLSWMPLGANVKAKSSIINKQLLVHKLSSNKLLALNSRDVYLILLQWKWFSPFFSYCLLCLFFRRSLLLLYIHFL